MLSLPPKAGARWRVTARRAQAASDVHGSVVPVFALVLLIAVGRGYAVPAQQAVDLEGIGYDKGNPDAAITIVEFGDFGCSACAMFARETLGTFHREFIATGRIRWKYVPFTLGSFPNSDAATTAAECAAQQDSFWSMHDVLYARQKEWNRLRDPRGKLIEFAAALGLDRARFARCYDEDARADRIRRANDVARKLFVRQTPTFFINGRRAIGALPIAEWRKIIAYVEAGG